MTASSQLQAMAAAHLPEVLAIERSAYEFPWSEANFRDALNAGYSSWVLLDGAQLQGYLLLSMAAGEAEILNICVAPSARRRGYGRVLLAHAQQLARDARLEAIFLEVRRSNVAAIALYQALGFTRIGERRGYYRSSTGVEDALMFSLKLPVSQE